MKLTGLMEKQDQELRRHALRVSELATSLALIVSPSDFDLLAYVAVGSLLHDVGKTKVSTQILGKPGKLDSEEMERMKRHVIIGEKLLRPLIKDAEVLCIVKSHHERWDGSGYPSGIAGTDISLGTRIVSVADAYDAMTTDRSYHKAVCPEDALKFIGDTAGKLWDPEIVAALNCLRYYSDTI